MQVQTPTTGRRRAVFLDRDGVIDRVTIRDGIPHPPQSLAELEILPGVAKALKDLAAAKLYLVVVTNQPDVARGTQSRQFVYEINRHLMDRLPLHEIIVCFHDNLDECDCRKPRPGMILAASTSRNLDLEQSFMVGDRWSDVVAGTAAGCKTILINTPYSHAERCNPDFTVSSLPEAADIILRTGTR